MIKFFRNIRKSLVKQGNMSNHSSAKASAGKYFKYAVGEIILVVIGILIAIQANNWNISRIEKKEQKFLLTKLVANLEQDTLDLNSELNANKTIINALDSSLIILKNPSVFSKAKFQEYFTHTNYTLGFNFNKITFDELSNTGKLKLISSPELVDSLTIYYNPRNYRLVEDAITQHTRDNIRTYTLGFDFMHLEIESDVPKASDFDIEEKSLLDYSQDIRIINGIRFKVMLHHLIEERYNDIKEQANYLLKAVSEELSTYD